jgi:serine/threonine-protein kinase
MQTMLGKYEIRGTLGKGAMGTVYDGYDSVIDRRVAIKTMTKPDPADSEAQEELARFRREAQAAGRLAHPNIVGVYDYGEEGDTAYIVMEYAPGTELKKVLDKGERMPPAEAVRIMQGVLAGLQYSHERGVVHRDIKPGNIILSPDGTVKIADFGIARIESSSMTQAGTVLGTPAYMSPEQFMGQTVDARTDIYSAGVMFYQLLTGERPFEGSMSAIMHKALNTEPPRPSDLSVTAPSALDMVVARAMAKRPEGRYESAAQFADAIRTALSEQPRPAIDPLAGDDATMIAHRPAPRAAAPSPAPAASPAPAVAPKPASAKGRGALFAGIGIACLAVVGAGAYFALGGTKTAAPPTPAAPVEASPAPAPAPPVKPQAAPVAPPPMPVPPLDEIHNSLAVALRNAACSLTQTTVNGGKVIVAGLVGQNAAPALGDVARAALPPGATADSYRLQLETFSGPYCDMLDLLRGTDAATMALNLPDGVTVLRQDDLLKPQMTMPDYPAWLTVDYIQSDGGITHLYPWTTDKPKRQAPGAQVVIGDTKKVNFPVGAPFGTDMIVAIASSVPLFSAPRPQDDTAKAYLAALTHALQAAQKASAKIAVGAMLVTTKPR